jgi:serine/threonine-protein kinase
MAVQEPGLTGFVPAPLFNPRASFGRYSLLALLGETQLGPLFLARLSTIAGFEKHVVLKVLHPSLARDERMTRLFLAEAHAAGRVQHANVCEVRDVGETDGTYFIVYEHLVGVPLSSVTRRLRRSRDGSDLRLTVAMAEQACEGLHAAHEQGVIHKDLSPTRLFVTAEGMVKVFALGAPSPDEMIGNTGPGELRYGYASPEQIHGDRVTRAGNVFSLGVNLFELITGRRLFARHSEYELCRAITSEPIPAASSVRPGIPPVVSDVLARALERDPARRLPTTRALGEALGEAIRPLGGPLYAAAIAEHIEATCLDEIDARVAPLRRAAELADEASQERSEVLRTQEEPVVRHRLWRRRALRRWRAPLLIFFCTFGAVISTWLALR